MAFARTIAVTLTIALAAGCGEAAHMLGMGECSEDLAELRNDPTRAAERAVAAGDRRLLAINGYGRWTPGALDRSLRGRFGSRTLENTSDYAEDVSCRAPAGEISTVPLLTPAEVARLPALGLISWMQFSETGRGASIGGALNFE